MSNDIPFVNDNNLERVLREMIARFRAIVGSIEPMTEQEVAEMVFRVFGMDNSDMPHYGGFSSSSSPVVQWMPATNNTRGWVIKTNISNDTMPVDTSLEAVTHRLGLEVKAIGWTNQAPITFKTTVAVIKEQYESKTSIVQEIDHVAPTTTVCLFLDTDNTWSFYVDIVHLEEGGGSPLLTHHASGVCMIASLFYATHRDTGLPNNVVPPGRLSNRVTEIISDFQAPYIFNTLEDRPGYAQATIVPNFI